MKRNGYSNEKKLITTWKVFKADSPNLLFFFFLSDVARFNWFNWFI